MAEEPRAPQTGVAPTQEARDAAMRWLDTAPPEEIMRHNRLGGIIGQRMNVARDQGRQDAQRLQIEQARRDMEIEYEQLAENDPGEFSRRFLTEAAKKKLQDQQEGLTAQVQQDFATAIGDAFKGLNEWKDLTPEEFSRLQQAVVGKTGKDVLAAFTVTAADIIAERKSNAKVSNFRAKELDREREALRTEEAAKLLQNSTRPDISNGSNARATFDPSNLSDKEFENWYRKNMLGRV